MTELANSMRPKGYITFRARALRPQCVIETSLASGGSYASYARFPNRSARLST